MSSTQIHRAGLAIEVRDLRKTYGEIEPVQGVSFDVQPGEVFCLLGPDGAGKTTIVEIRSLHLHRRPVDEVIELVELTEKRNVRANKLSGRQRRRLDLALSSSRLASEPRIMPWSSAISIQGSRRRLCPRVNRRSRRVSTRCSPRPGSTSPLPSWPRRSTRRTAPSATISPR
jgi:ABC-type glutathione transport system ATPase component